MRKTSWRKYPSRPGRLKHLNCHTIETMNHPFTQHTPTVKAPVKVRLTTMPTVHPLQKAKFNGMKNSRN
jgi:hypothetical protein